SRSESVVYACAPCKEEMLKQPTLLPGYLVIKEIGRGSMGAVFLAVHTASGQRRALKMIIPDVGMPQLQRKMFVREANVQKSLVPPRIVGVHEFAEVMPGNFCMAMEFVDGPSADKLLEKANGPLAPELAVAIVGQALEGLHYAHQAGV